MYKKIKSVKLRRVFNWIDWIIFTGICAFLAIGIQTFVLCFFGENVDSEEYTSESFMISIIFLIDAMRNFSDVNILYYGLERKEFPFDDIRLYFIFFIVFVLIFSSIAYALTMVEVIYNNIVIYSVGFVRLAAKISFDLSIGIDIMSVYLRGKQEC